MCSASLKFVLTSILSRQTAGIRVKSLIVARQAIGNCLNAVFPAIPCCINLIEGAYFESDPEQGIPSGARQTRAVVCREPITDLRAFVRLIAFLAE